MQDSVRPRAVTTTVEPSCGDVAATASTTPTVTRAPRSTRTRHDTRPVVEPPNACHCRVEETAEFVEQPVMREGCLVVHKFTAASFGVDVDNDQIRRYQ
jgi:hypothetical protein